MTRVARSPLARRRPEWIGYTPAGHSTSSVTTRLFQLYAATCDRIATIPALGASAGYHCRETAGRQREVGGPQPRRLTGARGYFDQLGDPARVAASRTALRSVLVGSAATAAASRWVAATPKTGCAIMRNFVTSSSWFSGLALWPR